MLCSKDHSINIIFFKFYRNKKRHGTKRGPPKDTFANGHVPKPEAHGYRKQYPQRMLPHHPEVNPHPYPHRIPPNHFPMHAYATPVGSHRGVPIIHVTPHGSHRGTPRGSVRGNMRGGSARIVITDSRRPPMMHPWGSVGPRGPYPMGHRGGHYPGPYGYPDPMMYPFFFPPQFPPQMVYVDGSDEDSYSDDDRRSNRSTLRERKMRYHRSFIPDRESKLVIK